MTIEESEDLFFLGLDFGADETGAGRGPDEDGPSIVAIFIDAYSCSFIICISLSPFPVLSLYFSSRLMAFLYSFSAFLHSLPRAPPPEVPSIASRKYRFPLLKWSIASLYRLSAKRKAETETQRNVENIYRRITAASFIIKV